MNRTNLKYLPALIGVALLGGTMGVQAQQTDFPRTGKDAASCTDVEWNKDMIADHPRLIEGCQEVVSAGGIDWARFEAQFNRMNSDGTVSFKIRDGNRVVEDVTFQPASGQVAYISNRPVAFKNLTNQQLVNLYVPEGEYGFSTSVEAPVTELAIVVHEEPISDPAPVVDRRVAAVETERRLLPATASNLPWIGLGGTMMMLTSLGMLAFRRNA